MACDLPMSWFCPMKRSITIIPYRQDRSCMRRALLQTYLSNLLLSVKLHSLNWQRLERRGLLHLSFQSEFHPVRWKHCKFFHTLLWRIDIHYGMSLLRIVYLNCPSECWRKEKNADIVSLFHHREWCGGKWQHGFTALQWKCLFIL